MTELATLILRDAWQQCQRHLHHLHHALAALRPSLPLQAQSFAAQDDEVVQDWDQFVLRFTKLQDTLGSKLLPAVLSYLQEPYEDRPMLDKLHRLEKLGYVPSVEAWNQLRVIRNRFAHDYPQDDALNAAALNAAVAAVPQLELLLHTVAALLPKAALTPPAP